MRGYGVVVALLLISLCASLALSQEKPKTAKKSAETDSTAPKAAAEVADPVLEREPAAFEKLVREFEREQAAFEKLMRAFEQKSKREQAAFKDWAKAMRETADGSKKLSAKEREAWADKTSKAKEDEIRAKYKLPRQFQFQDLVKTGLILHWPAESPEDLAFIRSIVDPLILEDEISDWVTTYVPRSRIPAITSTRIMSTREMLNDSQESIFDSYFFRQMAPITKCTICDRKTVGKPGSRCYEHRPLAKRKLRADRDGFDDDRDR